MEQVEYLLSKELKERQQTLVEGLARGAPDNYPEYCKLVGEIQGIQYALRALATIRSQISVDEDTA